jgi:ech hydrogenase subunit A
MNFYFSGLYFLPLLIGGILLIAPAAFSRIIVIVSSLVLSALAFYVFLNVNEPLYFSVPHYVNEIVAGADILMLLYFGWVAIQRKSWLVGVMSIVQLAGLLYLLKNLSAGESMQFMVDKLSTFMFLLINIVSGIIAVFTLRYIEEENCSAFRKKFFIALLFFFIGAMNLVVSADNLEYFFLFFELTTLASFLFIGFRKDEVSVKNALTALWMNQVGGIAILAAIFFIAYNGYGEITFQ